MLYRNISKLSVKAAGSGDGSLPVVRICKTSAGSLTDVSGFCAE